MSNISQKLIALNEVKQDIKTAITNKGVSVDDDFKTYPRKIHDIPTDMSGLYRHDEWLNDVNFYDIDGSILYSYTLAEAKALTRLPMAPEHEGLVFQEWNWTLADIQNLPNDGMADIGPNYDTLDGHTRIVVDIKAEDFANNISYVSTVGVRFTQSVANGITVDWGDGTTSSSSTTGSAISLTHTYTAFGIYTITLIKNSGTLTIGGGSSSYLTPNGARMMKAVYVGSKVNTFSTCAFSYGVWEVITLPKNARLTAQGFRAMYCIKQVTIPRGSTTVGNYAFYQNYSMRTVCIPVTLTTIGTESFYACKNLRRICLQDTCTSVTTPFGTSDTYGCLELKAFRASGGIATLDYYFSSSRSMVRLVVPEGVTTFSPTMTNSYLLNEVVLPSTLTTFAPTGERLYYVTILADSAPTASAAISTAIRRIFVPEDALSSYSTATYWKDLDSSKFKTIVE